MHDIKEASEVLNISGTAVYKWIQRKELKKFVFKQNGKTYIKPEGIDIIKGLKENIENIQKTRNKKENSNSEKQDNTKDIENFNNLILNFTEQLKVKDKQIEAQGEQLKSKDEQINNLIRLNENAQVLIKEQQNKVLLLEEKNNKKAWWKLF